MDKLQELRDGHFERQQKKALMIKIAKQFDQITNLKQTKEVLQYKLQALRDGYPATDLYPSCAQESEFLSLHDRFTTLKQKLSTCRLLGPCGLTVLDVQSKSLAVSLTSTWKDLSLSFVLHVADDKDRVKLVGTTIPYFIDVDAMISSGHREEGLEWPRVMDDLGYLLTAYTQRRREVEHVQSKHKGVVKQVAYNDPVTAVEMHLSFSGTDNSDSGGNVVGLELKIHLVYDSLKVVFPNKVSLASSHFFPKKERESIRNELKSKPLSQAMPVLLERLKNIDLEEEEEDEDIGEAVG